MKRARVAWLGIACLGACAGPRASVPAGAGAAPPEEAPGDSSAPAPAASPARAAQPPASEVERPSLLVMPLRAEPSVAASARALDAMILDAVDGLSRYRVLGPSDLNALLGVEQLKDAMGCDDVSCAAELGGALGAPFLVAGSLGELGDQVVLSLSLLDTKEPAVLARASQRGPATADALSRMMSGAVGELFGLQLEEAAPVAAPAPDYGELTAMTATFAKLMSNFEYTKVLAEVERWEKKKVAAPAGTDVPQLLTYYRFTACMMLKRSCAATSAQVYLQRWPDGLYGSSIQAQIDQLESAAARREQKAGELATRLAEIDALTAEGRISAAEAASQRAYAYFGAERHREAAELFGPLAAAASGERYLELVEMVVLCHEQLGAFDAARAVLEQAKVKEPALFKARGLAQRQRMLPR